MCVFIFVCFAEGRMSMRWCVWRRPFVYDLLVFFNGWITIDKGELFVKIITDFSGELAYYVFRSICILSLK